MFKFCVEGKASENENVKYWVRCDTGACGGQSGFRDDEDSLTGTGSENENEVCLL